MTFNVFNLTEKFCNAYSRASQLVKWYIGIVMKKSVYQQIDVFTVKRGYIYSFFF